jgi:hypothetical protein
MAGHRWAYLMTAMLTGAVVVARKTVVSAIVNQGDQVRTKEKKKTGEGEEL